MRAYWIAVAVLFGAAALNVQSTLQDVFADDGVAPLTIRTGPVNNPVGDPVGRNVQHTPTLVDLGGGKLVAAFYDAGSFNGTNNQSLDTPGPPTTASPGPMPAGCRTVAKGDSINPVLAFSKSAGAVFLLANNGANFDTLPVFKSTNAGHTFAAPVNAAPGYLGTGNGQFQPWMATDNFVGSGAGNIYVCWNRYAGSEPIGNPLFTLHQQRRELRAELSA